MQGYPSLLIHGLIKSELATFLSASGIFTFDQNGQLESFAAKRYKEDKGEYSLEDWFVEMKEHREFNGIIIPNKVDVT